MSSSKDYLDYILEQLGDLPGLSLRAMMGEYILYLDGCVAGGIYDDRLLVKDVPAARNQLRDPCLELPYPGAKPMLLIDCVDDAAALRALFNALRGGLTPPRRRRTKPCP